MIQICPQSLMGPSLVHVPPSTKVGANWFRSFCCGALFCGQAWRTGVYRSVDPETKRLCAGKYTWDAQIQVRVWITLHSSINQRTSPALPWPGFEPGLLRPQRRVLTTIRSRPLGFSGASLVQVTSIVLVLACGQIKNKQTWHEIITFLVKVTTAWLEQWLKGWGSFYQTLKVCFVSFQLYSP